MIEDIYQQLARHLDDLPGGFPPTESGVELRILRRLFTPDQAELARRAGIDTVAATRRLEEMAKQGLILRMEPENGDKPFQYMAAQFVIGIWEFHVNDLDIALIKDMNEYMPTLSEEIWKVPQLRTIPVGRSISVQTMRRPKNLLGRRRRFWWPRVSADGNTRCLVTVVINPRKLASYLGLEWITTNETVSEG
jgi:Na+-translocating ferredoxin:NAD+ oxidoreductase subunit B